MGGALTLHASSALTFGRRWTLFDRTWRAEESRWILQVVKVIAHFLSVIGQLSAPVDHSHLPDPAQMPSSGGRLSVLSSISADLLICDDTEGV